MIMNAELRSLFPFSQSPDYFPQISHNAECGEFWIKTWFEENLLRLSGVVAIFHVEPSLTFAAQPDAEIQRFSNLAQLVAESRV